MTPVRSPIPAEGAYRSYGRGFLTITPANDERSAAAHQKKFTVSVGMSASPTPA